MCPALIDSYIRWGSCQKALWVSQSINCSLLAYCCSSWCFFFFYMSWCVELQCEKQIHMGATRKKNIYIGRKSGERARRVWLTWMLTSSFLNMRERTSSGSTLKMALNRDGYGDKERTRKCWYILDLQGSHLLCWHLCYQWELQMGEYHTHRHYNPELGESHGSQITNLFMTVAAVLYIT